MVHSYNVMYVVTSRPMLKKSMQSVHILLDRLADMGCSLRRTNFDALPAAILREPWLSLLTIYDRP